MNLLAISHLLSLCVLTSCYLSEKNTDPTDVNARVKRFIDFSSIDDMLDLDEVDDKIVETVKTVKEKMKFDFFNSDNDDEAADESSSKFKDKSNKKTKQTENKGLVEGDMAGVKVKHSAIASTSSHWPNGVVPYYIQPNDYDDDDLEIINEAIQIFNEKTCVKWQPRIDEASYVHIAKKTGCWSYVGRRGPTKSQTLSLDDGCVLPGTVLHEMIHAVGFDHEQSRYDRDDFIAIKWENIMTGQEDQFEKLNNKDYFHHAPYDYKSVMHYSKTAFSKNGEDTIVPYKKGAKIGQRNSFSEWDMWEIRKLYNCENMATATIAPAQYTLPSKPPPNFLALPITCNFDLDECSFEQPYDEELNWKREQGKTRTAETGPNSDVSGNSDGYYLYMESSSPAEKGWKAKLLSPRFEIYGDFCVKFAYSMYGFKIGTLTANLIDASGNLASRLWTRSGDIGTPTWERTTIDTTGNGKYQVAWLGEIGGTSYSDMALDDIEILHGSCDSNVQGTMEPPLEKKPTTKVKLPWKCYAEDDMCEFSQETGGDFTWQLADSTSDNIGKVLLAAPKGRKRGQTSHIVSPLINDIGKACLQFEYLIGGWNSNLHVFHEKQDTAKEVIEELEGPMHEWDSSSLTIELGSADKNLRTT